MPAGPGPLHASPMRMGTAHSFEIWAHYRSASIRIGRELFSDKTNTPTATPRKSDDEMSHYGPTVPNATTVTRRKSDYGLHRAHNNNSDPNSNRYGATTRSSQRRVPLHLTRQLSLDLEEARRENEALKRLLHERGQTIERLQGENRVLHGQIRKLSAGRHSERSRWTDDGENCERLPRIVRQRAPSPESVSLSELSPVVSRKKLHKQQSSLTYSSITPESSHNSTPKKRPANIPFLPSIGVSRSAVPPPPPVQIHSPPRYPSSPSSDSSVRQAPSPRKKNPEEVMSSPAYFLKLNRPEFIARCQRRQSAIKVAAAARSKLSQDRRNLARAVVEGRASFERAKPLLRADTTVVKAFDDSEMRTATKKRFRSTSEFQSRIRERQEEVDRAASKLIARCFSVNTLQRMHN